MTLDVWDLTGRKIAGLINKELAPGRHRVDLDASALKPGMYYCRLLAGESVETIKMILE